MPLCLHTQYIIVQQGKNESILMSSTIVQQYVLEPNDPLLYAFHLPPLLIKVKVAGTLL